MNGPRLLSKGGVSITANDSSIDNSVGKEEETSQSKQQEQTKVSSLSTTIISKRKLSASTPITKYMWDDDGVINIAKIHIDTLPTSSSSSSSSSSTGTIKWEDTNIIKANVDVRLIGDNNEGLYISIIDEGGKRYHLHVPKMYGEADSVKAIVKKHKLLVKIYKKRVPKYSNRYKKSNNESSSLWESTMNAIGKFLVGNEDNNKDEYISVAWPRLSAASTGGLGGGSVEIDDKLFKEMNVKNIGGDNNSLFDM